MKKQLKNLAQKLFLGTTITLASLIPTQTQAQHHHYPLRNHPIFNPYVIIPIPFTIYSTPPEQSNAEKLDRFMPFNILQPNTIKHRTPFASRTNFFVYTWNDTNNNGKFEIKREMRGMDKKTFLDNENIYLGFQTLRLNNRTAALELIAPDKKSLGKESKIIESDVEFWYAKYLNPDVSIKRHGQEEYFANFYIDGICVGHRIFELKETPKPKNLEGYFLDGRFYPYEQK